VPDSSTHRILRGDTASTVVKPPRTERTSQIVRMFEEVAGEEAAANHPTTNILKATFGAGPNVPPPSAVATDAEEVLAEQLRSWKASIIHSDGSARFSLSGNLGEGSQGVVYSVDDRDCSRELAVKVMCSDSNEPEEVSRFIREAQITAQLEHPGVVPVHDIGVLRDGRFFYSMKRVQGQQLAEYMQNRSGRSEHRFALLELFLRVGQTIAFAHSRGVIHRDIKPRNIMVGEFGEVLLMDWGLAKHVGSSEGGSTIGTQMVANPYQTVNGTAIGTPAYMSPEQASGEVATLDRRCDIYSLGVILYEMLSGQSPYQRGNVQRVLAQVREGAWIRLDGQAANLPRQLVAVVHRAMALSREERYSSVDDMMRDVHAFLAGEAVSAYQETMIERIARYVSRNRRQVRVGTIVAAIALLCGIGAWYMAWSNTQSTISELRRQAASLELLGKLNDARGKCERILALVPHDPAANRDLVRLQGEIEDEVEAENMREALRVRKNAAEGYLAGARKAENFRRKFIQDRSDFISQVRRLSNDPAALEKVRNLQENIRRTEIDIATHQARRSGLLDKASIEAPDDHEVRHAVADFWVQRLLEAEAAGDVEAAVIAELKGRNNNDGEFEDILNGNAWVTVSAGMPTVTLQPLSLEADLKPMGDRITVEPGSETMVKFGRYLATNNEGASKALRLARGQKLSLDLPAPPRLPKNAVYVPTGSVFDDDGQPWMTVTQFALAEHEVTFAEYLEFLNDPATVKAYDDALQSGAMALAPRTGTNLSLICARRKKDGRFALDHADGGGAINPDAPVVGISSSDAVAYAHWRAQRDQLPWRLPTLYEWQLAIQGGDGRAFPWGFDDSVARVLLRSASRSTGLCAAAVGSQPYDRSVQGIADLYGSVSEIVSETDPVRLWSWSVVGGNFTDRRPESFSAASRRPLATDEVDATVGLRLALTLPETW
jgi:eukaryotic-like serine/threonine-protein kinase